MFLGRLSPEKESNSFLKTFYELNKYKLIVAGTGENIDYLKTKYKCKNIIFKDFLEGNEKVKILQSAIALIVPSIWLENYPMSIVEAFSCRVPAIASNIGGLPFIIEEESNGTVI